MKRKDYILKRTNLVASDEWTVTEISSYHKLCDARDNIKLRSDHGVYIQMIITFLC
jgi:hypothetical protein